MAYLRTATTSQSFNVQDDSTLALPPPNKLSTLARMDSEKRVNNQIRLMMQNKKGTIKRDMSNGQWNTNQKDIFDLGSRIQSMSLRSQMSQRPKISRCSDTTDGFSNMDNGLRFGIAREKQMRNVFTSYSMKGHRSISAPTNRKYSTPQSPLGENDVFLRGISTSRSEPDLLKVGTLPTMRRIRNKHRFSKRSRSFYSRGSKDPRTMHSHMISDTQSPDNVRFTQTGMQFQQRQRNSSKRVVDGVREMDGDMNLQKAVTLLRTHDPNVQAYASSYIQHKCFKEDNAKGLIYQMGAIPQLINLLSVKNINVQQSACAALRNVVYKNVTNKMEVKKHDGIKQVLQLLRETNDPETKKQATGLLWNLSSCDAIKEDLLNNALPVLTDSVIIPYGCQEIKNQGTMDSDIFYNATGCLRNLSSAGLVGRQQMRNSPGLIDYLMSHVQMCLDANQADEKSVENCVCIFHNLSYNLESEVPNAFAHFNENMLQSKKMAKRSSVGCFNPETDHLEETDLYNMHFSQEGDNAKGVNNLFHSKAIKMYTTLLDKSKSDATLEASAGALQNLTAGNKVSSYLMSSALVERQKAVPQVAKLLHSSNADVQKSAVSLLNNVSRHSNLHSQLASQTLPELARLLPSGSNITKSSDDTIASACNIMRSLIPNNTTLAKTVLQGSMLRNLMNLSKSSAHPSAGKAACLFLYEMWTQKELHSFFKKEGFTKKDFVNNFTSSVVKLAQQNAPGFLGKKLF